MMTRVIPLTIDKENFTPIIAKQFDTGRYLLFQILDNGATYDLTGKTVKIHSIKKDGTLIFNNLKIIDAKRGICELKLTSQLTIFTGILTLDLRIYEGIESISLIPFRIDIKESINQEGAIESTNEFSALTLALADVQKWATFFETESGLIEEKYTVRLNALETDNTKNKKDIIDINSKVATNLEKINTLLRDLGQAELDIDDIKDFFANGGTVQGDLNTGSLVPINEEQTVGKPNKPFQSLFVGSYLKSGDGFFMGNNNLIVNYGKFKIRTNSNGSAALDITYKKPYTETVIVCDPTMICPTGNHQGGAFLTAGKSDELQGTQIVIAGARPSIDIDIRWIAFGY